MFKNSKKTAKGFTRTPKFGVTPKGGGFTLIELLVVVAIISLLASVILASLNTARAKARDSRRFEDLHSLQIALDLYYNTNGTYPPENCFNGDFGSDGMAADDVANLITPQVLTCWNDLQTKLSPYMKTLPIDPSTTGDPYYYYFSFKSGQGYTLIVQPEVSGQRGLKCDTSGTNLGYYCIGENFLVFTDS